ncbi:MAG: nucleoside-diphosphate sugar epimerase [Halioglobus sp.]|nr:nucleoside-diphosphate sugar epimerase [Halioglobus sp.]
MGFGNLPWPDTGTAGGSLAEGEITVWCLLGRKAGDNTQVRALATALGWGCTEKQVLARPWELLTHLTLGATLAGIDRAASSELAAPWPDLVITAGRRNEPVARWIQAQSGGHTRLVHIGRPWAPLATWDLVITTPQYFLPEQANILHNSLPLHLPDADALARAAARLEARVADLPRPRIAVLAGGDSGKFVFTVDKGRRLGAAANALAAGVGGALLFTDSPRTPSCAGDAAVGELSAPHFVHRCAQGGENPYQGMLGLADAFIVTGESMSMLGEAAETGRPLYIFDMGDGDVPWWRLAHGWLYKPLSHRIAMRFGPARMRRDVGRIQEALVASGQARWLEEVEVAAQAELINAPRAAAAGIAVEELEKSAAAVRRLFA